MQADLNLGDYRLLSEFRHVLRQFLSFSEERAAELGLAPQQHQALLAIKGAADEPLTVGELAQRLVIRHNSAVGLVNRLAAAELIERRADRLDGRRARLFLTKHGSALLRRLTAAHRSELRRLSPLLQKLLKALSS